MNFEDLTQLYELKKQEVGVEAYRYISELLREAKVIHREDWYKKRLNKKKPNGDHEQSWRAFKGKNLEKLIEYIITEQVQALKLKVINGNKLNRAIKLPVELEQIKRNLVINYGEFGMHLPDVDLIIYNPQNYQDIIVLSIKTTLRERIAQTGYWKLKLMQSPLTEHILVYFITLDEDGVLNQKQPCKKARAIAEIDTDRCYVLTEQVIAESDNVKMFDKLMDDLDDWFSRRKNIVDQP